MDGKALAEKIDAEATAAEAENPDEDEEGDEAEEEQPDEQIEPESQLPPEAMLDHEKARKQMERESDRHEKRVREIMAGEADLIEACPLCQIPGFVFPFQPASPDEWVRREAVDAYFGQVPHELLDDPDTLTCPRCGGEGEMQTGSKRDGHDKRPCTECGAVGWVFKQGAQPTPGYQPVAGEIVPQSINANGGGADMDAFGRPAGHPNYGAIPIFTGDN